MKKALIWLLIVGLTSSRLWASPGADQRHIDSVEKKIASCVDHQRRVVIETYDDRRLPGFVTEAGTDGFVLSYAGQITTLPYSNVKRVKWQSPVWRQVEVVAGAAAVTGAIFGLVVLFGGLRG